MKLVNNYFQPSTFLDNEYFHVKYFKYEFCFFCHQEVIDRFRLFIDPIFRIILWVCEIQKAIAKVKIWKYVCS